VRVLDYQAARVSADPVESFARDALEQSKGWAGDLLTARMTARFGPVAVCIESCGEAITTLALEGLRHAEDKGLGAADFRIIAVDSAATGLEPPPAWSFPTTGERAHWCRQQFDDGRLQVGLNLAWRTWGILDREQGLGLVWSADAANTPEWVIRDQTRNILHWWSSSGGWGLFHAAALKLGTAGCLIAGKSGSGKSTVTAAAIAAGFATAGDDFVLIEPRETFPHVHSVFHTVKLDEASLGRVPAFHGKAFKAIDLPREKFLVRLFEVAPGSLVSGFPIHAILHSRVTGQRESRVASSTSARGFHAIAPSTTFELRSLENEIVARTAALVRAVPTYSFEFGTDVDAAIRALHSFMSGLQP
jgi:hypothetical protein